MAAAAAATVKSSRERFRFADAEAMHVRSLWGPLKTVPPICAGSSSNALLRPLYKHKQRRDTTYKKGGRRRGEERRGER